MKPWSISKRLAVFYALSTTLLFSLSGIFLYSVVTTDLETQDTKYLSDEAQGLRSILKETPTDSKALEQELNWEGNASKLLKYYVSVLDENNKMVAETKGIEKIGSGEHIPYPEPFKADEYPDEGLKWTSKNGNTYLLMTAWASVGMGGNEKRLLKLASDISDDEALIRNYRRQLFLVLFLGVAIASVTGAFIARRGLLPLRKITQSVQRISATQLHERIKSEKWPEELASLADEFDRMMDRLENSFTRLSQFSADLAHELRTPINNLMGETEVTLAKARNPEDYQEVLGSNLEEFTRLSRMIDSLLFLARAENPETVIEKTVSEVRREVEIVMDYYDVVAKENNVRIHCVGSATLNADFNLFRRAMGNLISNSLEHSPEGSQIDIFIEKKKDEAVEVKVCDSGEGIEAKHLPNIFNRFYRADSSRSKLPKGMGLGLAIVKSIMTLHGGTASIESAPYKGTSITLHFPNA